MIITLKLPYKTDYNFHTIIKQYSNVVRFCYNRFVDGSTSNEIRSLVNDLSNIDLLDSRLIEYCIKDGLSIYNKNKENKVIFGGNNNFIKLMKGKITKEEFNEMKLIPLNLQGEILQKGNRKIKIDIKNNKIIFKLNRNKHIDLHLPKLKNNYKKYLEKIEQLSIEGKMKFCVKIDMNNVYVQFDSIDIKNNEIVFLENRSIGIDLNPNNIGLSVLEFNKNGYKVIHKENVDLSKLTVKSRESSSSTKSKHLNNKLKFETIECCKHIQLLCLNYKCKFIFIEDLKFKKNDLNSKELNRLCKQKWLRTMFINNLKKRSDEYGIKLFEVNPCYSSIIGNVQHNFFDPVNASIEICRRGYDCIINKNKMFYPTFNVKDSFLHHWKETGNEIVDNWKEFFVLLKNSKLKYRVSLNECSSFDVFSLNNKKSKVYLYKF